VCGVIFIIREQTEVNFHFQSLDTNLLVSFLLLIVNPLVILKFTRWCKLGLIFGAIGLGFQKINNFHAPAARRSRTSLAKDCVYVRRREIDLRKRGRCWYCVFGVIYCPRAQQSAAEFSFALAGKQHICVWSAPLCPKITAARAWMGNMAKKFEHCGAWEWYMSVKPFDAMALEREKTWPCWCLIYGSRFIVRPSLQKGAASQK